MCAMSTQPRGKLPADGASPEVASAETQALVQKQDDTGPPPGPVPSPDAAAPTAAFQPLVGHTFDDLELIEPIGRGGMGLVFKGRQKSLDRLVAVKLLLAEHFADPQKLARFITEARAAASLDHPNIVQVYQIGESPFGQYFAMEYIDGPSLETLI